MTQVRVANRQDLRISIEARPLQEQYESHIHINCQWAL